MAANIRLVSRCARDSMSRFLDAVSFWTRPQFPIISRPLFTIFFLLSLSLGYCWAGGMKGSMESSELAFIQRKVFPLLIKYGYCTRASGDCVTEDRVTCLSYESLSCNVWGVTNKMAIFAITKAVLDSNINISQFLFWRSSHKEKGIFEKPLLRLDINLGKN